MQRHRKYLVITIWISTIAFIGAGFVGWGQYNYNDKAGAVAKVGAISITNEEFQQSYTALFNQYNQMLQGKLDEKQAKQFGLEKQALKTLINQALILNLAKSYGIDVSDDELSKMVTAQNIFQKNGSFDKQTYADVLTKNHLTVAQYEKTMRRDLLIQKTLYLFSPKARELEVNTFSLVVADKVEYKLLASDAVHVSPSTDELKTYWEQHKAEYKKPVSYELSLFHITPTVAAHSDKEIAEYFTSNQYLFKDVSGKLLSLEQAHDQVLAKLNDIASEKEALRHYIDLKKQKTSPSARIEKITLNKENALIDANLFKEITTLNENKPYLKPRKLNDHYVIVKLDKVNPSTIKTYEEAANEVNALYTNEMKRTQLQALAQNSIKTFHGTVSDFIIPTKSTLLSGLSTEASAEFTNKLFASLQKQGFFSLKDGTIVLYNILEQKLLQNGTNINEEGVTKLKGDVLNQKLLKALESKYPIQIFMEGI